MNILWIDLETRSKCNLTKCGVYRYATDPSTEIILFAYAWNSEPATVWDCYDSSEIPYFLTTLWQKADRIGAHNSQFERTLLHYHMPWLEPHIKLWHDTMIKAYLHALPGALGDLCDIFKIAEDKSKVKEGRELMKFFCTPVTSTKKGVVTLSFNDPKDYLDKWEQFKEYNRRDVEAERALDDKMPSWNMTEDEYKYWQMDQELNDRGIAVDTDLAEKAIAALAEAKNKRDELTQDLTLGQVESASQRDATLRAILNIYGVSLPDLTKSTIERRLQDPDLPEDVKELLRLRLVSASTCGAKYQVLLDSVCPDGRLHGTIQFGGAWRTMRDGGRLFQPQNLPRPPFKKVLADVCVDGLKNGWYSIIDPDTVKISSAALRGVIVADPGNKLVVVDLSSIEGRVLAWLAGEQWKLEAYLDYDLGMGKDMYVLTYAKTFGISPEDVNKDQRQMGKVLELALGYGGGIGAFITFSKVYNIDLEKSLLGATLDTDAIDGAYRYYEMVKDDKKRSYGLPEKTFITCDAIKRMWRKANPSIEQLWKDLESSMRSAIERPEGCVFKAGKLEFDRKGAWTRLKLPSGRYINYPAAKVISDDGEKLSYLGQNTYTRQWGWQFTYGGKLSENGTQAVSRDIFKHGSYNAWQDGYNPVLFVHDEDVTEVPNKEKYSAAGLVKHLSTAAKYYPGLPLNAAGFEALRYGKDD